MGYEDEDGYLCLSCGKEFQKKITEYDWTGYLSPFENVKCPSCGGDADLVRDSAGILAPPNVRHTRKSTFMADELAELEKQIEEEKNRGQYIQQATEMEIEGNYNEAIKTYKRLQLEEDVARVTRLMADDKVKHLDYDKAIELYESIGNKGEAARVRKLKADLAAPKTEIHGDYIDDRDTIVKDSVINRSNVGAGDDKFSKLKELKDMLAEGLIDDDEFKQMKKEILGK